MKSDQYFDREQMQELLRNYENLRLGKSSPFLEEEAFERIIDYFDDREDMGKALEAASIAIEHFPFNAALLFKKADLLIATRRYYQAMELLEKAELLDTTDINLYILKTDVFLALEQQEKAAAVLEEAIRLFEGEEKVELLFELSDVFDDYEEFEKVFDCLVLILQEEPTNEEALYKICFWTDFTGRNEESIRLHLSIIDEHPYNELAWFNLAAAYQGLKLYEKAIDAYQYALVIDEKFDYAYRNMGDAYIRLRKFSEAIEALEKVLELSKPEEVIYEAIGHCYDRLKQYAQARSYYRKASHMNAEDSKLYYKIACTYYNEGQYLNASKQLESALKLQRNQLEYNLLMGECKLRMGDFREAILYFSYVVRTKPRKVAGWEALVRCLYEAEYFFEAKQQALAALEATGNKPIFYYYLTAILFGEGKPKEALLYLEKGLELSPRTLKKLLALNSSLLQNSQVIETIARYKRKGGAKSEQ